MNLYFSVSVDEQTLSDLRSKAKEDHRTLANLAGKILTDFINARRKLAERCREGEAPA